jgi:putative transposase
VTRVLDRLALSRGLPQVIRTGNGKELCGKSMVTWAYQRGVRLRLIQPGKPNQEAGDVEDSPCPCASNAK